MIWAISAIWTISWSTSGFGKIRNIHLKIFDISRWVKSDFRNVIFLFIEIIKSVKNESSSWWVIIKYSPRASHSLWWLIQGLNKTRETNFGVMWKSGLEKTIHRLVGKTLVWLMVRGSLISNFYLIWDLFKIENSQIRANLQRSNFINWILVI